MRYKTFLMVILLVSTFGCMCNVGRSEPIAFTLTPAVQKICLGATARITLEAKDPDPCHDATCDKLTFGGWPPDGWTQVWPPTEPECDYRLIADKAFDQPGIYTYTITASDQGLCDKENDADVSATAEVHVCQIGVDATRAELEAGCGAFYTKTIVTCTQSRTGCDAFALGEPIWVLSGPIRVSQVLAIDRIEVESTIPTMCSLDDGTVTAYAHGCVSNPCIIPVHKLGAFTMSLVSAEGDTCYNGDTTWGSIPEPPPPGVLPTDPVYGCVRRYHYRLCIECPLWRPVEIKEEVTCADGCNCLTDTFIGSDTISGGEGGECIPINDSHMILSNQCSSEIFVGQGDYKRKQRYYIDTGESECLLMQNCIQYHQVSPNGNCNGFSRTVEKWPSWDNCSCQ